MKDAEDLLDIQIRNKELFQKYSPAFPDDFYTLAAKKQFIQDAVKEREEDKKYNFGIFLRENDRLIGDVTLFHLQRGPLQKCLIGYALDAVHSGKGYATEAVKLAVEYAFQQLKLHRIEAGAMPRNGGSMRVLEKAGFQKEGIERKGVKINGVWEDHQIFSIIEEESGE
ncbi:GNAT family N-acetyltransferase [Paenibacillus glycanilyticus]|nr:GNAT family N-acetyltransferase [Paenibacillus glycanilyticus]